MSKCNLSVREQEGGAVGGVAEGLGVIWASVICPSVNIIIFVHGRTIRTKIRNSGITPKTISIDLCVWFRGWLGMA